MPAPLEGAFVHEEVGADRADRRALDRRKGVRPRHRDALRLGFFGLSIHRDSNLRTGPGADSPPDCVARMDDAAIVSSCTQLHGPRPRGCFMLA